MTLEEILGEYFMDIKEIKSYATPIGWQETVKQIPQVGEYKERRYKGKKQGLDLILTGYEAGIRDAQCLFAAS